MKERPILFSAPMVRAILAGEKTQTRRLIRGVTPSHHDPHQLSDPHEILFSGPPHVLVAVRFHAGDHLWVRETWTHDAPDLETCRAAYEDACGGVGYGPYYRATEVAPDTLRWRPGIHMPRWASRIELEVTDVRVQRLQEISEEDAWAEGVSAPNDAGHCWPDGQPRRVFADLWDSINGKRAPWSSNPWVWAVTFRRVAP